MATMYSNNAAPLRNTVNSEQLAQYSQSDEWKEKPQPNLPLEEKAKRRALYPLSLIAIFLWIVYVVVTIWLLEKAATAAPRSIDQPWAFTELPGLMLTLFTQAHVPITGMHLARVGVSALQSRNTAPGSWAELFWLADRSWATPVGVVNTLISKFRLKVRVSHTFWMFALTCVVALVTPVILSRAYPVAAIDVMAATTISPTTVSKIAMLGVDAYTQIGTGSGSWGTGLSVFDIYNTSIYTPEGGSRGNVRDFFFAGDIQGANATLPGLRLQGSCQPFSNDASTAAEQNSSLFPTFCNSVLSSVENVALNVFVSSWNVNINYTFCTNTIYFAPAFDSNTTDTNETAYFLLQTSNGTSSTLGTVKCQSALSIGFASLVGTQGTYKSFQKSAFFNYSQSEAGEPLVDPLNALISSFPNKDTVPLTQETEAIMIKQLGYNATIDIQRPGELNFTQPSLDLLAERLWNGVTHMTAAIGLLSRTSDTAYAATIQYTTSGRTRSPNFIKASFALLVLWLCGLIYVSARCYRLSFGGSLNSYIAASLFAEDAGRIQHRKLSEDEQLSRPFVFGGVPR